MTLNFHESNGGFVPLNGTEVTEQLQKFAQKRENEIKV
jgi:hypothetical protein